MHRFLILNKISSFLIMSLKNILHVVCPMFLVGILRFSENVEAAVAVPPLQNQVTLSEHPVILIVSYDGFRYDYFGKAATPTFDALKASGVRVPYMEPSFPTMTFPNHQSIATGLYPETHGIVDNVFFEPLINKELNGFNDDDGFWNYHPDVLPIWIRNEMAGDGRTSGCLMWPGSSQGYGASNNSFPTYYYPVYNSSVPWEERVDTVISWMTNSSKPANLVFLYYNEPDSHGHAFGPNAPETIDQIRKADDRTAYLVNQLKELGIFDKINLIMLSDHGMKEVTQKHVIDITPLLDSKSDLIERRQGISPILQFDAKDGKVQDLYEFLRSHGNGTFSVWKREDLSDSYFHYSKSRRIMDLIVLANIGYAFDDFNATIKSHNDKWNLTASNDREYGVHGYSGKTNEMRPFFLAHGPSFKQDFDNGLIANVDIVPLITAILGIPEPPNNGSFINVEKMLRENNGTTTVTTTSQSITSTTPSSGSMTYSACWILLLQFGVIFYR